LIATTPESAGVTDIGGRENNEDSFSILARGQLIVVADGMGGHAGGDQASAQAVSSTAKCLDEFDLGLLEDAEPGSQSQMVKKLLLAMIDRANADIFKLNDGATGRGRMGTTLTLAYVAAKCLHIAWVGDSRVYLLRRGILTQLSDDHTLNYELFKRGLMSREELRATTAGHGSNVITRSLGADSVEPDYLEVPLEDGDILLCCSDGLNNSVPPELLQKHLMQEGGVQEISAALVQNALALSARDNVTAVVTRVRMPAAAPGSAVVRRRSWLQQLRDWLLS